jgi:hypothetical protein
MPALSHNFIKELTEKENNAITYKVFIETGTWLGDTILEMEPYFESLYTIEINEKFYNDIISKYTNNKINFLLGASEDKLVEILPSLIDNSIFFLDGHWSAGDTGRGAKDVPLYDELTAIDKYFLPNAIIIIDDVRLFGKGPNHNNELCNWEEINEEKLLST